MNDDQQPNDPGRDDAEQIEPTPGLLIEDAEPTD